MDFTYFIAAFLALIVGFCGAVLFVLQKRHSVRRLIGVAFVASLTVNGSALINWSAVGNVSLGFLLLDFCSGRCLQLRGLRHRLGPASRYARYLAMAQ